MLPLDELKQLESELENAAELGRLKPIFQRMAEIARQNDGDLDVQLAAAELRQHIIDKGLALKQPAPAAPPPNGSAPQSSRVVVVELPAPPPPQRVRPPKPLNLRRAILIGAGLGIAAWLIIFVVLIQIARNHNMPRQPQTAANAATAAAPPPASSAKTAAGSVPVNIATTPAGAAIQINGETRCKSDCRVDLTPGNYQVTAALDGFDPSATGVTVVPGNPINVNLSLVSQTQTVRLYTDLAAGKAILDGQPAADLQDGQLVLDRVANGKHTLRLSSANNEARFSFETAAGQAPTITGPVVARNMFAVLVASSGHTARIVSSSAAPVAVALNGAPRGDAGPQGLVLDNVPPGDQTLTVGSGPEQRKLVVSFGAVPSLTAFLKTDVNTGTLVVTTGEENVTVYVNGKPYARKTRRGELRLPAIGDVRVRVAKAGFQPEAEQTTLVKKGEETKLAFHLTPLPKLAALQIRNAAPGIQILLDDSMLGRLGPDGSLSAANLAPGEHTIEARREGFVSKRIVRTLKPGESLVIPGADLALAPSTALVHLVISPSNATLTYRRNDEAQPHTARDTTLKLDPGAYTFTVRAPDFVDRTERTTVSAGETRTLEIALARETRPAPAPVPKPRPTVSWAGWSKEGDQYVRKGGDRVVLHSGSLPGTITFTAHLKKGGLFRGSKLRWFVEDGEGYSQFELDKKKFQARGPDGARSKDRLRGGDDENTYTVQIDITPTRIIHRMKIAGSWITVDSQPAKDIADGRFGFVIPASDEVAISGLQFTPRN